MLNHETLSQEAWQQAFGSVPETFDRRVERTVERMRNAQPSRPRAPMHTALILACVLVLCTGAALALSGLGLLDTLTDNLRRFLQPGAQHLVHTDIAQSGGELQAAMYRVEQALYDGRQLYLLVRVRANDPTRALLMDSSSVPSLPIHWRATDGQESETFSSLATRTGRDLFEVRAEDVSIDGLRLELVAREATYEGEDLLCTLTFAAENVGGKTAELQLFTYNIYAEGLTSAQRQESGVLTFSMPQAEPGEVYIADTPIPLPLAGLSLGEFTLEQTPVATYLRAQYGLSEDATDRQGAAFYDGIWIEWLDEHGELYPEGSQVQWLEQIDENTVCLTTAYRAFDALPQTVRLSFFNGMTKERYDAVDLPIHHAKED